MPFTSPNTSKAAGCKDVNAALCGLKDMTGSGIKDIKLNIALDRCLAPITLYFAMPLPYNMRPTARTFVKPTADTRQEAAGPGPEASWTPGTARPGLSKGFS
ncbi:hypothetical protein VOLCADRAFT_87358 [Volvox carteri f. nagariensis]|uniref:Uncharacterized protein n=1 Tax=Volvox carteri f. nagariensis TaxID=3068 RepID=D8TL52_VOLCA|nr:uncharacterized protein VOLCADRAFT_87358 [Volvox carteri f. nagariensis]EFJ51809.1 hypothetical protein VOLCADRAFT_87358 [Volvox carteri f. nagariensis]|eukprot:XP_002947219.1 hypothetical protein VOLCADRAFT_87358 [Volvox carteri f. nagariensis]